MFKNDGNFRNKETLVPDSEWVRGLYSLLSNVVSVTGHHPPPAYKAAAMIVQPCIHQTVTPLGDSTKSEH